MPATTNTEQTIQTMSAQTLTYQTIAFKTPFSVRCALVKAPELVTTRNNFVVMDVYDVDDTTADVSISVWPEKKTGSTDVMEQLLSLTENTVLRLHGVVMVVSGNKIFFNVNVGSPGVGIECETMPAAITCPVVRPAPATINSRVPAVAPQRAPRVPAVAQTTAAAAVAVASPRLHVPAPAAGEASTRNQPARNQPTGLVEDIKRLTEVIMSFSGRLKEVERITQSHSTTLDSHSAAHRRTQDMQESLANLHAKVDSLVERECRGLPHTPLRLPTPSPSHDDESESVLPEGFRAKLEELCRRELGADERRAPAPADIAPANLSPVSDRTAFIETTFAQHTATSPRVPKTSSPKSETKMSPKHHGSDDSANKRRRSDSTARRHDSPKPPETTPKSVKKSSRKDKRQH